MKSKIEQNHRDVNEMSRKRRDDAQQSVKELNQFISDENDRKARERYVQQQYKGILETQVKMKTSRERAEETGLDDQLAGDSKTTGEMYMVPGINSVSPYVKQQRKGQPPLGEHHIKMKRYIDKDKMLTLNGPLTAQTNAPSFRDRNATGVAMSQSVPKSNAQIGALSPAPSYRGIGVGGTDLRPSTLKESAKHSLVNDASLYYDPIVNPIPTLNKNKWNIQNFTLDNNRSMTEKMLKIGYQGYQSGHNPISGAPRSYL